MGVLADGWQAASLEQLLGHGPDGHEEVELLRSADGSGWLFGCRHMPAAGGASSGVVICPPMPGFYQRPESIDDIVNHSVVRILDQFGLHLEASGRWGEEFALGLSAKALADDSDSY